MRKIILCIAFFAITSCGKVTITTKTYVNGELRKEVELTKDIYNPYTNQVERITAYENDETLQEKNI